MEKTNNKNEIDIKYRIEQGDYNKYVELRGIFNSTTPQALEVRDKNALYYVIYKNNKLFSDFCVFVEDNWFTLDRRYLLDNHLMEEIITILKEKHSLEYITVYISDDESEILKKLETTYNVETSIKTQEKWVYIKVKINLYQ